MSESRIIYTPRGERRRERFRGRKRTWLWIWGVFVMVLIGGAVYLIRFPELQLRKINIFGNKVLLTDEIRGKIFTHLAGSYAFFLPKSSTFLLSDEGVGHMLRNEFPRIRSVEVSRDFPDTLNISIDERDFWGMYCVLEECAYIDDTGFAYEKAPESVGALVKKIRLDKGKIETGKVVVDPALIQFMRFLNEGVENSAGSEIVEYYLISDLPSEIRVLTNDGFRIYFNREDDFENVFRVLKRLFEEEIKDRRSGIEYVDIRFGNKVFYK